MSKKKHLIYEIQKLVPDPDQAEELFCQTMLKITTALSNKNYEDKGFEFAWAKQVARNTCLDHFRRVKVKNAVIVRTEINQYDCIHYENAEAEIITSEQNAENCHQILAYLDNIPADQREILILRYYANLSFKEIAKILDISINTALGRVRYALRNIRKYIQTQNQKAA